MNLLHKLKLTFWIALTVFALSSCTKDDSGGSGGSGGFGGIGGIGGGTGGGDDSSRTQMLTGKSWLIASVNIDPGVYLDNQLVTNLTPYYGACLLDNTFTYKTDFTYVFDEGPTKCDPNDPQIDEAGTWAWSNGETQLTHTSQGESYSVMMNSINATQMVISYTDDLQFNDGTTATHTFTITYK